MTYMVEENVSKVH